MISVIVPYWNAEQWIGRCVNSLKKQEGEFTFILVNDKSKDKSKSTAKKTAKGDDRFIFIDNQRAKGVSGARNTGIDIAKGEWITFLDADDELLPDAWKVFERMTQWEENILQANHLRQYSNPDRVVNKMPNNKGIYDFDAMPNWHCMVWNKLFRRDFIGDTRFIEGLHYGEDEIFILDLLAKDDRIRHTLTNTVTVLRHFDNPNSLSRSKVKDREGLMAQTHALEEYIMRTNNPKARKFVCETLSYHWSSSTYLKAFGQ